MSRQNGLIGEPGGGVRLVTRDEHAQAAEREISDGWRKVAETQGIDAVVAWALAVGDRHGWPLDERWTRQTFEELLNTVT